jgi:hypothetical protein
VEVVRNAECAALHGTRLQHGEALPDTKSFHRGIASAEVRDRPLRFDSRTHLAHAVKPVRSRRRKRPEREAHAYATALKAGLTPPRAQRSSPSAIAPLSKVPR